MITHENRTVFRHMRKVCSTEIKIKRVLKVNSARYSFELSYIHE